MSKTNICVIGLSQQFADDVCKELSKRLDMYYANVEQIIEFELIDVDKMQELCGMEYFNKKEFSVIKRICTYENTLINLNFNKLNSDKILEVIANNCLIIYLRIQRNDYKKQMVVEDLSYNEQKINLDVYHDRDNIIKNIADIIIECTYDNMSDFIDNIIESLLKYYT